MYSRGSTSAKRTSGEFWRSLRRSERHATTDPDSGARSLRCQSVRDCRLCREPRAGRSKDECTSAGPSLFSEQRTFDNGNRAVKVALISTYELGRQPFGLASPAAWLGRRGHDVVCVDTSRQRRPLDTVTQTGLVAFYLPMHTAARLAVPLTHSIRHAKPGAHVCGKGLYAPIYHHVLVMR